MLCTVAAYCILLTPPTWQAAVQGCLSESCAQWHEIRYQFLLSSAIELNFSWLLRSHCACLKGQLVRMPTSMQAATASDALICSRTAATYSHTLNGSCCNPAATAAAVCISGWADYGYAKHRSPSHIVHIPTLLPLIRNRLYVPY